VFLKTRRPVGMLIGYTVKKPRADGTCDYHGSQNGVRHNSRAQRLLFVRRKVDEREPRTTLRTTYVVLSAFFAFRTPYPVQFTMTFLMHRRYPRTPSHLPFGNADDTCMRMCACAYRSTR